MNINASFLPLIQDLKAEYPDISENVIVSVVHSLNGFLPSIRVALDARRTQRLRGSHHADPPKMVMPHFPRGRPASFPSFDSPLKIDVDDAHLPDAFQMEDYTEHGRRPRPPNYVNSVSLHNEGDYVQQQRQRLNHLLNEMIVARRHHQNAEAQIRCREQLMNQREFGSDQTFPSVTHILSLRQEVFRKRCELRNHIPFNPNTFHEGAFQHRHPVSAPGTPEMAGYNLAHLGHRQLSNSHAYPPLGGMSPQPPVVYPTSNYSTISPPPVPPHRSYSARSSGRSSSQPTQPPPFPSRLPPHAPHPPMRRPPDPPSRANSHRNSTGSAVQSPPGITSEEAEGSWSCSKCTFLNHFAMRVCEMCDTPKVIPKGI